MRQQARCQVTSLPALPACDPCTRQCLALERCCCSYLLQQLQRPTLLQQSPRHWQRVAAPSHHCHRHQPRTGGLRRRLCRELLCNCGSQLRLARCIGLLQLPLASSCGIEPLRVLGQLAATCPLTPSQSRTTTPTLSLSRKLIMLIQLGTLAMPLKLSLQAARLGQRSTCQPGGSAKQGIAASCTLAAGLPHSLLSLSLQLHLLWI